jgi:preprotein translocase subunit SecB
MIQKEKNLQSKLFKIENIRQIECFFALNPEFKPEKDKKYQIGLSLDISFQKKGKKVRVILKLSSEEKEQPFVFRVIFEGIFVFDKIPEKEELERIVHINCASIMFPFIRESVADLTRRAGLTPLILDPVNFVGLYESSKEKEKKEIREKQKSN